MAELTRAERLKRVTAENIENTYRRGYITAAHPNKLMREKAPSTVGGLLGGDGFFLAIWERTIQHLQEGWDQIVRGVDVTGEKGPEEEQRQKLFLFGMAQA